MTDASEPGDAALRTLLRAARPDPPLPPRFQEGVWRRIDGASTAREARTVAAWLDRAVASLLRPRLALTGVAVMLLLGTTIGVVQGMDLAQEMAKQRYLTAVSPLATR
ncbi:MAG: hypothetical protein M5U12_27910 [Verrucomicrobia bacterium]|nr:hypothetical protein [Verrucomicrobiota bacterium]